jgi:hypothetical protein
MTSVVLCLSLMLAQGQPRDTRNAPDATAVVRGRVFSAATGSPIRGAMVSLVPDLQEGASGGPLAPADVTRPLAPPDVVRVSQPRLAAADDAGYFAFEGVAPGRYRLVATAGPNHGRYLASGYGATRPNEAGRALVVAAGQEIKDANIGLMTGSAIEGRVVDDTGEPVARAVVKAARLAFGSRVPQAVTVSPAQTDDLGRFRLYGLEAGTYVVLAEGQRVGFRRYPAGTGIDGETYGFLTTYHPSSTSGLGAQHIHVLPLQELSGIDIQLVRSRRHSLSGTIVNSQGQPQSANAALISSTFGGHSSTHVPIDGAGRFSVPDLDPGDYTLQVRVSKASASQRSEFADKPLTLNSDLTDVVVVTSPGVTVSGRVVFAEATAADSPALSVNLHGVRMQPPAATFESSARVDAELRFTVDDAFGPKLLRFASLPPGWALHSVMLGANDITDQPTVFRAEHDGQIQMIVTTRAAAVEGVVTDEKGAKVGSGTVYVFSEDRASWKMGSPRTHRADIRDDGRFALRGLAAGRYLAVAVSSGGFRPVSDVGEEFFEALKSAAEPLTIGDGERRTLALRIWRWPE